MCACIVSTAGNGHPYIWGFVLLFCGLCDTFDGKVTRAKKNRTDREKAFGVLPASIAVGLLTSDGIQIIPFPEDRLVDLYTIGFLVIVILYVLAALIRLAFFNVLDEEKRDSGDVVPKGYVGLPVTSAALIFPVALLMHYFIPKDLSNLYIALLLVTGFLFLGKFRVQKPGKRMLTVLLIMGAAEFVLLLLMLLFPS